MPENPRDQQHTWYLYLFITVLDAKLRPDIIP